MKECTKSPNPHLVMKWDFKISAVAKRLCMCVQRKTEMPTVIVSGSSKLDIGECDTKCLPPEAMKNGLEP